MKTEPEAIIDVRFLTTAEGGRRTALVGDWYRACFQIDGEYHDGCFLRAGQPIELGVPYEVPVVFVCPDLVLPKLTEGKPFTLWEGKVVATGKVVRVLGGC